MVSRVCTNRFYWGIAILTMLPLLNYKHKYVYMKNEHLPTILSDCTGGLNILSSKAKPIWAWLRPKTNKILSSLVAWTPINGWPSKEVPVARKCGIEAAELHIAAWLSDPHIKRQWCKICIQPKLGKII